jgi:hypothetical protein
LNEAVIGTEFLQTEVFPLDLVIFLQGLGFAGGDFDQVMKDGFRDLVMGEMGSKNRGISPAFDFGELAVEDLGIDLAQHVLMIIIERIESFEDPFAVLGIADFFLEVGPIRLVDLDFFPVGQGDLLHFAIADGELGIKGACLAKDRVEIGKKLLFVAA